MTDVRVDIVPAMFPELSKLVWNRDPHRPVTPAEAFALYERNWRFIAREHLTEGEASLIRDLQREYGHGFGLI